MNLISNSVKFTSKGKIQVILEEFDEFTIVVKVLDNGTGVKSEK
jgi:signal transduction histidine kinase